MVLEVVEDEASIEMFMPNMKMPLCTRKLIIKLNIDSKKWGPEFESPEHM